MTQRKPLPEIARCGKNEAVLKRYDNRMGTVVFYVTGGYWIGPKGKTERAAILAWNRVMSGGSSE
jgi:hypothetical protein